MSSLLSGDAVSGNFQTRLHPPAADLTFAGRFKSVGRLETFSNVITVQANGQKSTTSVIDTSIEVPTRPIYEDNNDSNTSCSRLSPYDELEPKLDQNRLKSCEETSKQYFVILVLFNEYNLNCIKIFCLKFQKNVAAKRAPKV